MYVIIKERYLGDDIILLYYKTTNAHAAVFIVFTHHRILTDCVVAVFLQSSKTKQKKKICIYIYS